MHDDQHAVTPESRSSRELRQLSESLFVFDDTCNVYLVRDSDAGLLIDSGSGGITEVLDDAGVTSLEWVLHTHHHRDQCWGTPRLVAEHSVQVAVPEYERYLFESATEFWRTKRLFDNYDDRNTFFTIGEDIPVDAVLEDYEEFRWRRFRFLVLPAKGHTFGSSALLGEIDGRAVAFTGDLLVSGGHAYQLHAFEYGYGDMAGVLYSLQSLNALRRREPDCILPSHGGSIEAVSDDIDRLTERLMDIVRLGSGIGAAGNSAVTPETRFLPEAKLVRVSEHLLWSGPWACSNFYVLLSGSGEALLIDYGHAYAANMHVTLDPQPFETMRFIVHSLEELQLHFGVTTIEVVAVTHTHDDHVCGIPYLQRHHKTAVWALDEVAVVLEHPAEWASAPCTCAKPIRVDRKLGDGERIAWRGFELTFHHAPGQSEFHSIISAQIDGKTVAFTGDNYFLHDVEVGSELERRPYQTTVFRNSFQLAMHRQCVDVMRSIAPDLICPGHNEILPCDQRSLDQYADYVALKEQAFRSAVAEPVDHHIDLFWARLRPYFTQVTPDTRVEFTLVVRNNLERTATFGARLLCPPEWTAADDIQTLEIGAREAGEFILAVTTPNGIDRGRVLITAEISIDGRSQGPIAEALVVSSLSELPGVRHVTPRDRRQAR